MLYGSSAEGAAACGLICAREGSCKGAVTGWPAPGAKADGELPLARASTTWSANAGMINCSESPFRHQFPHADSGPIGTLKLTSSRLSAPVESDPQSSCVGWSIHRTGQEVPADFVAWCRVDVQADWTWARIIDSAQAGSFARRASIISWWCARLRRSSWGL